jgi:hypothetical protein
MSQKPDFARTASSDSIGEIDRQAIGAIVKSDRHLRGTVKAKVPKAWASLACDLLIHLGKVSLPSFSNSR